MFKRVICLMILLSKSYTISSFFVSVLYTLRILSRFASSRRYMTRSDCGGQPATRNIPGEGKRFGNCAEKDSGGVLFYGYDIILSSIFSVLSFLSFLISYAVFFSFPFYRVSCLLSYFFKKFSATMFQRKVAEHNWPWTRLL